MGKVYEALLRAESNGAVRGVAGHMDEIEAVDVEDERAIRNPRGFEGAALDDLDIGRDLDDKFDGDGERGAARYRESQPAHAGQSSRFSFLRYSLGSGSSFDKDARSDAAATALTRRAAAQPPRAR